MSGMADIESLAPVYTRDTDPNKLSDSEYEALKALIQRVGFLQSITIAKEPIKKGKDRGKTPIIDGHHRFWIAKELGLKRVPVVIYMGDDPHAAVGLGMNHLRGSPDLQLVGATLTELSEAYQLTDLSTLTGYPETEITDLISMVEVSGGLDDGGADDTSDDGSEALPKPFLLEIRFDDRATYRKVKRLLTKAAGESKDLAIGLLNVLGETQ